MSDTDLLYTNLEEKLGLHQEISVIYVVDGYCARLLSADGTVTIEESHGDTIADAMADLDAKVSAL